MKKKGVIGVVISAVIAISLLACGAEKAKTSEQNMVNEAEQPAKEEEVSIEETLEDEALGDAVSEEVSMEENAPISWYMDEDGLKNDTLGMCINRENGVADEMELMIAMYVFSEEDGRKFGNSVSVWCRYYDGSLDDFMNEYPGAYLKEKIDDIEYAYVDQSTYSNVVIVENGLMVEMNILEISGATTDYLKEKQLFTACDDFGKDCLAYITENGLYCPGLGLAFTSEENLKNIDATTVRCFGADGVSVQIYDVNNSGFRGKNAQQVLDDDVKSELSFSNDYKLYTEIEGTVEKALGQYTYFGRGVKGEDLDEWSDSQWEQWLFYSEESDWYIRISYDAGGSYETCLSIIQEL